MSCKKPSECGRVIREPLPFPLGALGAPKPLCPPLPRFCNCWGIKFVVLVGSFEPYQNKDSPLLTYLYRAKQVRLVSLRTFILLAFFYRTTCIRCFPTIRLPTGILRIVANSFTMTAPPPCAGVSPSLAARAAVFPFWSRISASVGRLYTLVFPAVY